MFNTQLGRYLSVRQMCLDRRIEKLVHDEVRAMRG